MGIAGLLRLSTVDFPGRLAAVVFIGGCNYDCFYCHNRALISFDAPALAEEDVWRFFQKRKGLLDGVVLSGGEAALWRGLPDFLEKCKENGFDTKLDTNGSRPETVHMLLAKELLDYVAVDYKAPFARYAEIGGEGAREGPVRETFAVLLEQKIPFEARTTVFPTLSEGELVQMAREAPVFPRYVLNGYRKPAQFCEKDADRINAMPYTKEELQALCQKVHPFQPNCVLGTV